MEAKVEKGKERRRVAVQDPHELEIVMRRGQGQRQTDQERVRRVTTPQPCRQTNKNIYGSGMQGGQDATVSGSRFGPRFRSRLRIKVAMVDREVLHTRKAAEGLTLSVPELELPWDVRK